MAERKWFVMGGFFLGLIIGFMVGLSVSPVVNTVLGLVFAFAGGSIVVLIKGRQDHELGLIGRSLTAISIAMIVGATSGIVLRANNWLQFDKKAGLQPVFQLEKPLTVKDIIALSQRDKNGKEIVEPIVIRALLRANAKQKQKITRHQIDELVASKVHPNVIITMVDEKAFSEDSPFMLSKADIEGLTKSGIDKEVIAAMVIGDKTDDSAHSQTSRYDSGTVLLVGPGRRQSD